MSKTPKHARENSRGKFCLSDLKPSNLHPKAKFRISIGIIGTLLLIFGCIYMLSTAAIVYNPDLSTAAGLSAFLKNLVAIGYVVGTVLVIFILWYVAFHDLPLTPAAKANYEATHDKSGKGVKLVAAMASAVANKGQGQSIEAVAAALDNYFEEPKEVSNGNS